MTRLMALSTAEAKQFFRNKLLVFNAPWPILLAVLMVSVVSGEFGVALASSAFLLISVGFVVFYSALSMATTRRDEKVLKRLRTGEARDWEILTAISVPLSILVVLMAPISVVLVNRIATDDVPALVHPGYMALALLMGIPCAHGLALLTSRFTQNAESAIITSLPILFLTMLSLPGGIRVMLPPALGTINDWNPFALAADLFTHGWIGEALSAPAVSATALAVWTIALTYAGNRWMRWDTHR